MFIAFLDIAAMLTIGKKFTVFILLAKAADLRHFFLIILGSSEDVSKSNSNFFIRFSSLFQSLIYEPKQLDLVVNRAEELESPAFEVAAGSLGMEELTVANGANLCLYLSTSIKRS